MSRRLTGIAMSVLFAAGAMCCVHAYDGKNVNARAVSVNYRHADWMSDRIMCCECYNQFADGALVLYTIRNSAVTAADTIHARSQGLAHYPAFNLSGNLVAFYRENEAPAGVTGCQAANGGKNTVSVIDINTKVVTNLCDLPSTPNSSRAEMVPLDWPAGDWIYYERTHEPADVWEGWSSSINIWRVNAVTKANEKVCSFSSNGQTNICTYFRRFTLSLDGARMAAQTMEKYACTATPYLNVNAVWGFPPAGCAFTGRLNYADGCNIAISPSGEYMGSYLGGQHADIFLNRVDGRNGTGSSVAVVNIRQLETWAGTTIGNGAELIRWSANSDKWVIQQIGFSPDGHAGELCKGSNPVVANWTDQVAINISKNRNQTIGSDIMYMNNCTGDFWVSDPANNPNGTRYEDLQGVWHDATGATAVQGVGFVSRPQTSPATVAGPAIKVSLPGTGPWHIVVSTADGRIVSLQRGSAGHEARIATAGLSKGVYLLKLTTASGSSMQRFLVR